MKYFIRMMTPVLCLCAAVGLPGLAVADQVDDDFESITIDTTKAKVTDLGAVGNLGTATWFVDSTAFHGGNGMSWAGAFDSIEEALAQALVDDRIWVRVGTYVPRARQDPADPRSATFLIPQGVGLFGGFDGTEKCFSERAGLYDQTILTGDRGIPGDHRDNVYHVVRLVNFGGPVLGATTVDGFTIRDGFGKDHGQGAGIETINCCLLLGNCIIRDNRAYKGAGLSGTPGIAAVRCCQFIDNRASFLGGAIWGQMIIYKISNCVFRGNSARKGGAIFFTQSLNAGWRPKNVINNSVFHDNTAIEGGAIFLPTSPYKPGTALIANSTIAGNTALQFGGGVRARTEPGVKPAIGYLFNCVVWGNTAPVGPNLHGRLGVVYSNIEGGTYLGAGNISADPLFVDFANRDLRLLPGSPCHDAGNISLVRKDCADVDFDDVWDEIVPIDLDGKQRFADDPLAPDVGRGSFPIVDMGPYEL